MEVATHAGLAITGKPLELERRREECRRQAKAFWGPAFSGVIELSKRRALLPDNGS